MSGVEFIAVLGAIAASYQLTEAGIKGLAQARQYDPAIAKSALARLEELENNAERICATTNGSLGHSFVSSQSHGVAERLRAKIEKLREVYESCLPVQKTSLLLRTKRKFRNITNREKIAFLEDELQRDINGLMFALLISLSHSNANQISDHSSNAPEGIVPLQEVIKPSHATADNVLPLPDSEPSPAGYSRAVPLSLKEEQTLVRRRRQHRACRSRQQQYTYSLSLFRRFYQISLCLSMDRGPSLHVALTCPVTVPFTFPGFVLSDLVEIGLFGPQRAFREIQALHRAGRITFDEVDPRGRGWSDRITRRGWRNFHGTQFPLIQLLTSTKASIDSDILYANFLARPRLYDTDVNNIVEKFRSLLLLGIDLPDHGTEISRSFSRFASLIDDRMDVLFGLLATAVRVEPNFGGFNSCMTAILVQGEDAPREALLPRHPEAFEDRNCLGQSVLHLCIWKPTALRYLLEHGGASVINEHDNNGFTPLMYAMRCGVESSVILLLEHGAFVSTGFSDSHQWHYTLEHLLHCSSHIFISMVEWHRSKGQHDLVSKFLDYAVYQAVHGSRCVLDQTALDYLLTAGADFTYASTPGESFMNFINLVRYPSVAQPLLDSGRISVDHQDWCDRTALMEFTRRIPRQKNFLGLFRKLLQLVADINAQDIFGQTALTHLLQAAVDCNVESWVGTCEAGALLVSKGSDILRLDDCDCFCSNSGCTPLNFLFLPLYSVTNGFASVWTLPWLVEWYMILDASLPDETMREVLHTLFQTHRFEELGMTHTCCKRFCTQTFPGRLGEDIGRKLCRMDRSEAKEIQAEEDGYKRLLVKDVKNFLRSVDGSYESAWVLLLARRCAFMEQGIEAAQKYRLQDMRQRFDTTSLPLWNFDYNEDSQGYKGIKISDLDPDSSLYNVQHTGITVKIDKSRDKLEVIEQRADATNWTLRALNNYAEIHLPEADAKLKYDDVQFLKPYDQAAWQEKRRRLVSMFMAELEAFRALPVDKRPWEAELCDDFAKSDSAWTEGSHLSWDSQNDMSFTGASGSTDSM